MSDKIHYRSLRGHNWAPHVRREIGEDVTDMPAADRAQELADGTIEAYTPDDVTVAHLDDLPGALDTWQERMGQMSQTAQEAIAGIKDAALKFAADAPPDDALAALNTAQAQAEAAVAEASTAVITQQAAVTSLQAQYHAVLADAPPAALHTGAPRVRHPVPPPPDVPPATVVAATPPTDDPAPESEAP